MSAIAQALSTNAPWLLQDIAWPMLWQSSLLIGFLFLLDLAFKRRLRPAVRYALWLLVLLKLILSPALASPSALAWWVRRPAVKYPAPTSASVTVNYGASAVQSTPVEPSPITVRRTQHALSTQARVVLFLGSVSLGMFAWMLGRWRQMGLMVRAAPPAPAELQQFLQEDTRLLGFKHSITVKLVAEATSPAVFGLIRPVILLPESITRHLNAGQLRAVLMHELIHLKRGDVWMNCFQTLLQILYWWHPLLWVANARIRRIREEAVDDSVMCALRGDADIYPQALLEVAKLALRRSISSLALVGIFESRYALYQRVERLLDSSGTSRAGITLASGLCILAFSAVALPMGPAPTRLAQTPALQQPSPDRWPDARFPGYVEVPLSAQFLIVESSSLELFLPGLAGSKQPLILASNEVSDVERKLDRADAQAFPHDQIVGAYVSGGRFHYRVGGRGNNSVDYQTVRRPNGSTVVIGAECACRVATRPDWVDVDFTIVPWTDGAGTLCQLNLGLANHPETSQDAEITIPSGGALIWRVPGGVGRGETELVLLKPIKSASDRHSPATAFLPKSTVQNSQLEKFIAGAKRAFDSGNLDAAEELLHEALQIDRRSPAAYYYLNLIRETRAKQRPPVRLWYPGGTNLSYASTTPQTYLAELRRIRLKRISFDHLPLMEVVSALNSEVWPDMVFKLNSGIGGLPAGAGGKDSNLDNISQVPITILPDLTDIRLIDVLDAIVRVSPRPITYSVQGDSVVFVPSAPESKPLYTRVIKVETNIFLPALSRASAHRGPNEPDAPLKALLDLLTDRGINLRPPGSLFFSDISGYLMVRATLADLDKIEGVIHELNTPPIQLNIKVRFLRIPDSQMAGLWQSLGALQTGEVDGARILAPAQTTVLLDAIEKSHGALLNEASVTTISDRQTRVESVDLRTIASNNVPIQIPLGPAIDMKPSLTTEGWKIRFITTATLTEFLGYDAPSEPQLEDPTGLGSEGQPMPHVKVTLINGHDSVPDGYSLLLDQPFDRNSERSGKPFGSEKRFMVLLTPTLLDGLGKRMHTDAEIESLIR